MRHIFSGKNARDTEFAGESLIHPTMAGSQLQKKTRSPSKLTVTEQQQESPQIDDFSETRR